MRPLLRNGTEILNEGTDPHRAFGHEGAEYSIATVIRNASAYAWWVRFVLRKRKKIFAAENRRYISKLAIWTRSS